MVEYDMDDEDDRWLQTFNQEKKVLSSDKFELIIDRLEKAAHRVPVRSSLLFAALSRF
jgi:enhancer of polycomb-like protein